MKKLIGVFLLIACAVLVPAVVQGTNTLPGSPISPCDRLYRFYDHFGFAGSVFGTPLGSTEGLEGGVGYLHAMNGNVWAFHFENDRIFGPLNQRQMYFAHISSVPGCGRDIPDYTGIPPHCVVMERKLTWAQTKAFFRASLNSHNRASDIKAWEDFLTERIGYSDPYRPGPSTCGQHH